MVGGSPPRRKMSASRLGHRRQGLLQEPGPSRRPDRPLHSLSQLSPEDTSPAHGLGSPTLGLVPPADDLARSQPPLRRLVGLGSPLLLGRRSFFSSQLRLYPCRRRCLQLRLIIEQPRFPSLSKRSLERQGRSSRGTPTPPGYGYLTRHLPHRATHAWLSGPASRQASSGAQNGEETWLYAQIHKCSGLDSHNEHTPALKVPLQTGLQFRSRDNDLRSGWPNSSSYDLRADTAATRSSPSSLLEGRGQAIKATKLEAWSTDDADDPVGDEDFSGCCHHLSTDGGIHLSANTALVGGGRPKVHQQALTPVLVTRTRMGPSQNTGTALTAYDVL
jgi:hypothetical protein